MAKLLALFIVIPMIELIILLKIGEIIDLFPTLMIIVVTGFIGASLAKKQGRETLQKIQSQLAKGTIPSDSLIDGIMILFAGALLVTPGLLTDFTGFFLLMPFTRGMLRRGLKARFEEQIAAGKSSIWDGIKKNPKVNLYQKSPWERGGDVIDISPDSGVQGSSASSTQPHKEEPRRLN